MKRRFQGRKNRKGRVGTRPFLQHETLEALPIQLTKRLHFPRRVRPLRLRLAVG